MKFQERPYTCGAAAACNALRCFNIRVAERRAWGAGETNEESGTDESGVLAILRRYGDGLTAREYHNGNRHEAWLWLLGAIGEGASIILCVDAWLHWVVGMGRLGNRVLVFDSANFKKNKAESGIHILTKRQLMRRWVARDGSYYAIALYKQ